MQIRGAVDCIIIIQNYGSKKETNESKDSPAALHLLHFQPERVFLCAFELAL